MIRRLIANAGPIKNIIIRVRMLIPYELFEIMDGIISRTFLNRLRCYPYHDADGKGPSVFILGPGRSGNTVFKRELSRTYDIYFPPELPNLGPTIRAFARSRRRSWNEVVATTLAAFRRGADVTVKVAGQQDYNLERELAVDWGALEEELLGASVGNRNLAYIISSIVSKSYLSVTEEGSLVAWGEKTPWNIFHLPALRKAFPSATFVFMVRDPVPVVSSYLTAFEESSGIRLKDAIFRWNCAVGVALNNIALMDRAIIVRYEDFVADPVDHVRRVGELANLKYSADSERASSVISDMKLLHHANLSKPVSKSVSSTQLEKITEFDVKIIRDQTCTRARKLGYG